MRRIFLAGVCLALLGGPSFADATIPAPTINSSVVIATGNTFQTILSALPANSVSRHSLTVQNNNATDSCWLSFGTKATAPISGSPAAGTLITAGNAAKGSSILLLAGGSYTRYYPYVPSDEIEATCASSSDTLYLDLQ